MKNAIIFQETFIFILRNRLFFRVLQGRVVVYGILITAVKIPYRQPYFVVVVFL